MPKTIKFYNSINVKILVMMLVLFVIAAIIANVVNYYNLHAVYEKNFTERVRVLNNIMANVIDSEDVVKHVEMLRNQDEGFKTRQVQFYHDREELFRLVEEGVSDDEIKVVLDKIKKFHIELNALKTDIYWQAIESLKRLKEESDVKYVYVFADTDVYTEDGTKLYTYIFDAEDQPVFNRFDSDGLGTVNIGVAVIDEIYKTKKPMETVMYYNDIYGELYYAYAPVFNNRGEVAAIMGIDVEPGEMHSEIKKSMIRFGFSFLSFIIAFLLLVYILLNRFITKPLEKLTGTAQKLAEGEVYTLVPHISLRRRDEIGALAYAINEMSSVYQAMIRSTGNLFDAANIGKLYVRNDASNYKGDIKKVITQINETLDATTDRKSVV